MSTREMPIFPLSTVLFPQGPLALKIFETRYVDMVRRCMRSGTGFGVVLIVKGEEVGAAASTAAIGTEAKIVDFDSLDGGLLGLSCVGQQRILVTEAWSQADGLAMASVTDLSADPVIAVPEDCEEVSRFLQNVWPDIAQAYAHVPTAFNDAGWVANRLTELAPLQPTVRQLLLEETDPVQRLRTIAPMIRVRQS